MNQGVEGIQGPEKIGQVADKAVKKLLEELEEIVTSPDSKQNITVYEYKLLERGERIPENAYISDMIPRIIQDVSRVEPDLRIAIDAAVKQRIFL